MWQLKEAKQKHLSLQNHKKRHGYWTPDKLWALVVIAPTTILVLIFVYGFIGWTTYISFTRWRGIKLDLTLNGFENYFRVFGLARFQSDLRNLVVFTLLFLAFCLAVGLGLALLLDTRVRGEGLYRAIFLFPMALSFVVTGTAWQWIFAPGSPQNPVGINQIFKSLGLPFFQNWSISSQVVPGWSPDWLATRFGFPLALLPVVIAAVWQMSGFTVALYLAGLRTISDELYEAARVDGAGEWLICRAIKIPLLKPITLSAIVILGHISLKIFDLVVTQTGGGPGNATDVPGIFMYETTFGSNKYAEGGVIAIVMLVLVASLIVPYLISSLRGEHEQ